MGTGIKKILITVTALGLVLSSVDMAFGASTHHKQKKPHKSSNVEHAKQQVEIVHFLKRMESNQLTSGDQAIVAALAAQDASSAQSSAGFGSQAEWNAVVNAIKANATNPNSITQLISSFKQNPAVVTVNEWDKLATQVKSNTGALATLTTTVNQDVMGKIDTLQTALAAKEDSADVENIKKRLTEKADAADLKKLAAQESADVSRVATALRGELAKKAYTADVEKELQGKASVADVSALQTKVGTLQTQQQDNTQKIKDNLSLIHQNLESINANTKQIHTAKADIETNTKNIHQLGLAVQTNANQIVRLSNNQLLNMKAMHALGETVKQNVAGTEINTQLAKALTQQAQIDESALQTMNERIFENAEALGNTTVVSEDGDDLAVGSKNLANLSQLLAVAHHHNAQAHKAANTNLHETTARLRAVHLALTKAQAVSKHDATLTHALKAPIKTAHNALKTSQRLQAMIDKQKVRLHMQGKSDSAVIAKLRTEKARIAKQTRYLQQHVAANHYKKSADENAKRAHNVAAEKYYDALPDKQPLSARDALHTEESRDMTLKED